MTQSIVNAQSASLTSAQLYRLMTTGSTDEQDSPRTIMEAHYQWMNRPDDQRYESLPKLFKSVNGRRRRSQENVLDWFSGGVPEDTEEAGAGEGPVSEITANLPVQYIEDGPMKGGLYAVASDDGMPYLFSNWSFSQFNTEIGGPPVSWLRDMPAPIAAMTMNASLQYRNRLDMVSQTKLYLENPREGAKTQAGILRAVTSPSYGRIYDAQVVRAVIDLNDAQEGRWVVPGAIAGRGMADMYTEVTKKSTTLYASDRDIWLFMVDESHPIEIDGDLYFRGFIVSNSETGAATFRLMTFLLRAVCMNRIIHGALQIRELRIRHTKQAPSRFIEEARPTLAAYADSSVRQEKAVIQAAKRVTVAEDIDGAAKWLAAQGFTQTQSVVMVNLAEQAGDIGSSGDPTNLWNLGMAGTAYARELPHQDVRVDFEQRIGGMLLKHSDLEAA